ncbi:isochorismate synthase MenF [Paracoccus sp. p4-l81]|uniref:isochorismate synthase n=1 Tax=unclassified Paracoccus (in: a-proteobacteria) TaxID=2688777 RepID=UPI0035B7FA55
MNPAAFQTAERSAEPTPEPCVFAFHGPQGAVRGWGAGRQVTPGSAATLAERLDRHFASARPGATIGGALPFDRSADDHLWQPQRVLRSATPVAPTPGGALATGRWQTRAEPSAQDYARSVAAALDRLGIADGAQVLRKVVLARTLAAEAEAPIPVEAVLARLSEDPTVTAYRVLLPDSPEHSPWTGRALVGATPELLVSKAGRQIASHPLAGSIPRQPADPAADGAAAARLAASDKDHREHAIVVEYIMDLLAPLCRRLACPAGTTLTQTRSMWHLGTRIEGELADPDMSSAVLAARLHPTPAVCGLPVDPAACLIRQLEPVARGFYAGAVGWCDSAGDGAWFVAIRCADICGPRARLFAGAGIVPGSDPQAEAAETGAKFRALLRALGLPEDAAAPEPASH